MKSVILKWKKKGFQVWLKSSLLLCSLPKTVYFNFHTRSWIRAGKIEAISKQVLIGRKQKIVNGVGVEKRKICLFHLWTLIGFWIEGARENWMIRLMPGRWGVWLTYRRIMQSRSTSAISPWHTCPNWSVSISARRILPARLIKFVLLGLMVCTG